MVLMCKDGDYKFVADAHVQGFINNGYVAADGVPPTPKDELAALKEENARLKAELEEYKANLFEMLKPCEDSGAAPAKDVAPAADTDAPAEEKPKRSRKTKTE